MRYRIHPQDFTLEELSKFMHTWKWITRLVLKSCLRKGTFSEIREGHYRLNDSEEKPC